MNKGYNLSLKQQGITMRQFYSYRLFERADTAGQKIFNSVLYSGKLLHQYLVDSYVKIESYRLDYLRFHQLQLRADTYQGVQDYVSKLAVEKGLPAGRPIILPSTFIGGPRSYAAQYQDALSICRKYGKPDLFITFTCNPAKQSIVEASKPCRPDERPDIVARVFQLEVEELMKDLTVRHVLGRVVAFTRVIEFQKRGLPHCHILLILDDSDKPRDADRINSIVQAEIPDPQLYPRLYNIVTRRMLHRACGEMTDATCRKEGSKTRQCTKHFPKEKCLETKVDQNGYPSYRRRMVYSTTVKVNGDDVRVSDEYVVPFNSYLMLKYESHLNVEICTSVSCFKYLYKYIFKGPDRAKIGIQRLPEGGQQAVVQYDEITTFVDARYISAPEAYWRIANFVLQDKSHVIVTLPVHLPGQQTVVFNEDNEEDALCAASHKNTRLTAFFQLSQNDNDAQQLHYHDVPQHYRWDVKKTEWIKRQRLAIGEKAIGRMYSVSPNDSERFHLRLLLLNVRGPRSFEELRSVDSVLCATFKEAAAQRGLLLDDHEYRHCLEEAAFWQMPIQLRHLFATILVFGQPQKPVELWAIFEPQFSEDYRTDSDTASLLCYDDINTILAAHSTSLETFGIHRLSDAVVNIQQHPSRDLSIIVEAQTDYDRLNTEQKTAVDLILSAVRSGDQSGQGFYLDGPGGCGKTFVYNTLIGLLKADGVSVISVAWTGIAANLLTGGRTVHNRFKLPLDLDSFNTCNIKTNSKEAEVIRQAKLIIWDEAPMAPAKALEAIDVCLQDVMRNKIEFGGKIIVLGGDFRQCLPVIRRGFKSAFIKASLHSSRLWMHFESHIIHLTSNMRAGPDAQEFANWLLELGDGKLNNARDEVDLSNYAGSALITGSLVDEIFGAKIDTSDNKQLASSVILCPRNDDTFIMNDEIVQRIDSEEHVYESIDTVETQEDQDKLNFPTEYLYSITPTGMPPHILKLRKGTVVMLLRNLNIAEGLCNGTRLVVRQLRPHVLRCNILTGQRYGEEVMLPRITLTSQDPFIPFTLSRRQFPVRVAFAMTINKAQGQTFGKVGLLLREPVFSHGQLYVAFSRVRALEDIKVKIEHGAGKFTKNVVYREVLQAT